MKVEVRVRIGREGRKATWEPKPDGPVSEELRGLVAAFEVGEMAKGMVADIIGGPALTAFGNEQTRNRPR